MSARRIPAERPLELEPIKSRTGNAERHSHPEARDISALWPADERPDFTRTGSSGNERGGFR
jgi:hypothetical protein